MQIKTKLLLFLFIFAILFLSILAINWYINKSGEELYVKVQNEKLKQSVKISLTVNNELFASIANENSYWDEMRDFSLFQDSVFENNVLKPMVNYENVDHLWTYNLDAKNICTANKKRYKHIENPIVIKHLYNIFDTTSNSNKRFTNFYIKFICFFNYSFLIFFHVKSPFKIINCIIKFILYWINFHYYSPLENPQD